MAGLLDFQNVSVNSYVIQAFYRPGIVGSTVPFLIVFTQSLPLKSVHKLSLEKYLLA